MPGRGAKALATSASLPSLLGVFVAGLGGCSRGHATTEHGPIVRPLEMLVPTDAETLDPRHATDAVALRTTRLLHAGLVRLDPDTLEPKPYLARAWTWVDARTRCASSFATAFASTPARRSPRAT